MSDSASAVPRERLIGLVNRLLESNSVQQSFSVDDSLTDIGLSSIDMVSLLLAVEAEFDMEIPQHEITPGNFGTIAGIEGLVARLRLQSPNSK